MLFMYVHTHTVDRCLAGKPEELQKLHSELTEGFKKEGIKVTGAYSAPSEHTLFLTLEANDLTALHRALIPMFKWGTARLIPVAPAEAYLTK